MEPVKSFMELCRLCATLPQRGVLHIFGPVAHKYSIVDKIHKYSSSKVSKDDGLPQRICVGCISKLNVCHAVMQTSLEANIKLLSMQTEMSGHVNLEKCSRNEVEPEVEILCFPDWYCASPIDLGSSQQAREDNRHLRVSVAASQQDATSNVNVTVLNTGEECQEIPNISSEHVNRSKEQENNPKGQLAKLFGCIFCEETFPETQSMFTHYHAVHEDKVQECLYCGEQIFGSEEIFKSHLSYHFGAIGLDKPKNSPSQDTNQPEPELDINQSRKLKNNSVQNKTVSAVKKQKVSTVSKKLIPKKVQPKQIRKCDLCNKQFKNGSFLTIHREIVHKEEIKKLNESILTTSKDPLQCEHCTNNKIFANKKSLYRHCKRFHSRINNYSINIDVPKPHAKKTKMRSPQAPCIHCERLIESHKMLDHVEIAHSLGKELLCRYCDVAFIATGLEQPHMRRETALPLKCDHCKRGFIQKKLLTKHMKLVHNVAAVNESVSCNICGKIFKHKDSLSCHIRRIHILTQFEGPFICHICGKNYNRNANLKSHIEEMHSQRLYPCRVCGKNYSRKNILTHMKTHDGPKESCKHCGKLFMSKQSLSTHLLRHEGIGPVHCLLCTRYFDTPEKLQKHSDLHVENGGPGVRTYQCHICSKYLADRKHLQKHITIVHLHTKIARTERTLPCSLCSKKYCKQENLDYHMVTCHTVSTTQDYAGTKVVDKTIFSCQYCGKVFPHSKNLKDHEAKHRGEKNYSCSICGSEFYYWTSRKLHMQKQHGQGDGTQLTELTEKLGRSERPRKESIEEESYPEGAIIYMQEENMLNSLF